MRDAYSFLRGAYVEAAMPAQPMRDRLASPVRVTFAAVELGDKQQPTALGGSQMTGQRGDLGFEPLERHGRGSNLNNSSQRSLLDSHGEAAPIVAFA